LLKIKYIDSRPLTIPYLEFHKLGVDLPSGDNILKVNESEARHLLKTKNGENPCFELIKEKKVKEDETIQR
jgi:topoisomerase IA-like protein